MKKEHQREGQRHPEPALAASSRELYAVLHGRSRDDARQVDRLIHQRTRLAIVSVLAVNEFLTFNELKQLLGITDGNLSVHARKLEEAGYIRCKKTFAGRIPRTEYRLAAAGRRALERYLKRMETLIQAVRAR
ncbi:MAG: winged helix-turn-helix domain-containing protein [Acidobacteriota bacterium]